MQKIFVLLVCLTAPLIASVAQSKTTNSLQTTYSETVALFFYKNTLRMLNQADNPEFDDMVRNIEKLKFLMVDKEGSKFGPAQYAKLVTDYRAESYEAVMTSRMDGRTFDVYMKDKKGAPLGTVVLINDSTNLFILDMIGTIDIAKAGALFSAIDGNTDVGKQIKNFVSRDKKKRNRKDEED